MTPDHPYDPAAFQDLADLPVCMACNLMCASMAEDTEYNYGHDWAECLGCAVARESGYDEGGHCHYCGRWCRVCLRPGSDECGQYCLDACDFMDFVLPGLTAFLGALRA